MKRVLALLLAACLAGCSGLGPRQADRYFILDAGPAEAASQLRAGMVVAPTTAASFYDTQDIVFSRAPGTRGYYQFNHWTERPQRAIGEALAERLGHAGAEEEYVLATHVLEIYHDAAQPPGMARIAIAAELLDAKSKAVLARRTFARSAPVPTFDAAGAVRGFNDALHGLLADVAEWADAELAAGQRSRASAEPGPPR